MTFHIKQHSTLPKLKMQMFSGSNYSTQQFMECLKSADIKFSMWDLSCKSKIIACRRAKLELVDGTGCVDCPKEEYVITVDWTKMDTMAKGRYKGEFTIEFSDGNTLIAPIGEDLTINII